MQSELTCRWGSRDAAVRKAFLALPAKLYDRSQLVQNIGTEKAILEGRHPLSGDFEAIPFVVTGGGGEALARCLLTLYPDDDRAYVGFFESVDNPQVSSYLLTHVEREAARLGKTKLTGPLNASFWIGYRMKINLFDSIYTAEPYNKDYYAALWEQAGFAVSERYYSVGLRIPTESDSSMKCRQRLERFQSRGYSVKPLTKASFDRSLGDIYDLLTRVYAHFPTFRPIAKEKFTEMFGSLRHVVCFDMVKLVYKRDALVGFSISIPNYRGLTHRKISLFSYLKIRRIKAHPDEFVMLYMGIAPEELGLGSAIAELVKQELVKKGLPSINALIHEGTVSGAYYRELATRKYEYVLMEKEIAEK